MAKLPKLKKKISAFLTKEEGKISKEALVKTGVLVAGISVAAAINSQPVHAGHTNLINCDARNCGLPNPAKPCNNCNFDGSHNNLLKPLTYSASTATAEHNHCIQACSHGNHASHGSHGQW